MTTNLCIDRLRRLKRRRLAQGPEIAAWPDEQDRVACRDLVLRMLNNVSAEDSALAVLRYMDGLTLEEMEQVCGLTRKTISKKLDRFQKRSLKIARAGS